MAAQDQLSLPHSSAAASSAPVVLPAETKIELFVIRPVWAAPAKVGDAVYAQVSFPAVADDHVAIPAGAYVLGTIENVTRPTRRTSRAEIEVLFTKIIFANGYTVELPGEASTATSTAPDAQSPQGETLMEITVQVTTANDLLLDNGAGIEMVLGAPLVLDATQVAKALPMSHAPQPSQFKTATMCRYIPGSPGTPGTPDTVIPGSPGTPSTTIPGGPGMPDITIPGTPATPDTVIPGTPGTPGTAGINCPPAPLVILCAPVTQNKQQSASQRVGVN